MSLPTFEEIMSPLLEFLKDSHERNYSEVANYLKDHFPLSQEDLDKEKLSGGNYFYNRIGWAKHYLVRANLLEDKRGKFKITSAGINALRKNQKIDRLFVRQLEESSNLQTTFIEDESKLSYSGKSPDDLISDGVSQHNDMLCAKLSKKLKSIDPAFFEQLILDLVEKLGYGEGKLVGGSGDKGIDGEVSQDTLGLDKIYLQAKRHITNVPSRDIRDFLGALLLKNARKGIFITTSDFPSDAYNDVERSEKNVILINGKQLIDYMIKYNVGVRDKNKRPIIIKEIDENYFDEF